jgi:glycine/D-amino acid oxidase-like deaminating enzyme
MKVFDFVVIGAGIAGSMIAYMLKEYNVLVIDKKGILEGASKAAGAFIFPKVGFNTKYTRFINNAIVESINFYKTIGVNTHTKGVLILPRDERDIEKFKKYEKEITIPFKRFKGGFFFEIGSIINPEDLKNIFNFNFLQEEVIELKKEKNWIINNSIESKNVILATGFEKVLNIEYLKIRPIWGERIEIEGEWENIDYYVHKNCSVGIIDNRLKIGATHKRDVLDAKENLQEAYELLKKAKEIIDIKNEKIVDIKGGFRAASIDYFPTVGPVIDAHKTLQNQPRIVKGEIPKKYFYVDGLYVINGMGGRGFSNAYLCAKMLKDFIEKNISLGVIGLERLFVKWARKEGDLRRNNVKS